MTRPVFLQLPGLFCLTIPYVAPVSYDKPPAAHDLVTEHCAAFPRRSTVPPSIPQNTVPAAIAK
jgi:hypothetical protein